jgi:polyisoprenoid-binding protein YceI
MKKVALVLVVALMATINFSFTPNKAKTFKVDAAKSSFAWVGKKVGGEHNGTVGIQSGSLVMDGANLTGGEFVIDMKSLACLDITNKDYNGKFIGHMSGVDFFNIEKFPTASLKITNAKPTGAGQYQITGDLTIKGITNSIVFPATVTSVKGTATAAAKFELDRTKWDIKYGSGLIGTAQDKIIYDNFSVAIALVATK